MPQGNEQNSTPGASDRPPTIAIYQNPDHVAGILQQLYFSPLLTDESREHDAGQTSTEKKENKGHAGGKADAKVPLLADLGLDVAGDRTRANESALNDSVKTVQNFRYSQAHYLHLVRQELGRRDLVRSVGNARQAESISVGDFVEFQASFRPNALHALLDILTPNLIAAITEYRVKAEGTANFPDDWDIENIRASTEELFTRAQIKAEIARAVTEAVRIDFRAEKTREFYGQIDDVTAITICDNPHFTVDDEDRILDGSYSVLGKVTSKIESDVPILSRNKLLDRISPALIDSVFETLRESVGNQATSFPLGGRIREFENAFNLALPSRIAGPSFRVVPIAVFV